VHLLDTFTSRLKADLAEVFVGGLNRRYSAVFQVGEVSMVRASQETGAQRWHTWASEVGRISFGLDRELLLSVLHYRYGLPGALALDDPEAPAKPETATETRLTGLLGLQLLNILSLRIDAAEAGQKATVASHEFTPLNGAAWASGEWVLTAVLRELAHGVEGQIRFRLDDAWLSRLLRNLAPQRDKAVPTVKGGTSALPRLPVTLVARLLEQDMPLGSLLDMRVGDVIPVHLGSADVLVDNARLFQAAVAEHKGKLCLTSFVDSE